MKNLFIKLKTQINKVKYSEKFWPVCYCVSLGVWAIFILYLISKI